MMERKSVSDGFHKTGGGGDLAAGMFWEFPEPTEHLGDETGGEK